MTMTQDIHVQKYFEFNINVGQYYQYTKVMYLQKGII